MTLVLEWKNSSRPWVDFRDVSVDQLASASLVEMDKFRVWVDGGECALLDHFLVSRRDVPVEERAIPTVIAEGDFSRALGLGTGMRKSRLVFHGNAGDATGRRLQGGTICILGNAGHYLAEDMKQGLLCVFGDCGDHLAGPSAGRLKGMSGGDLLVYGSVGARAFERMRRGTAFVSGSIGAYACHQMIAGTVIAMGDIGASCCHGMRRGSFVVRNLSGSDAIGLFTEPMPFELSFLSLLWRHVASLENHVHEELAGLGYASLPRLSIPSDIWVHRMIGDLQIDGRGEIIKLDNR